MEGAGARIGASAATAKWATVSSKRSGQGSRAGVLLVLLLVSLSLLLLLRCCCCCAAAAVAAVLLLLLLLDAHTWLLTLSPLLLLFWQKLVEQEAREQELRDILAKLPAESPSALLMKELDDEDPIDAENRLVKHLGTIDANKEKWLKAVEPFYQWLQTTIAVESGRAVVASPELVKAKAAVKSAPTAYDAQKALKTAWDDKLAKVMTVLHGMGVDAGVDALLREVDASPSAQKRKKVARAAAAAPASGDSDTEG
jgi:hypothetical protein